MTARVILRVPTVGAQAGDEIEVESSEVAEALVRNGSARRVPGAPKKSAKSD